MRQRMTGNEREENLMARRKMVMADEDELYLLNISNYIMEKAPQWELNIFTKVEKLIKYLENSDNIDILVVDEIMNWKFWQKIPSGLSGQAAWLR